MKIKIMKHHLLIIFITALSFGCESDSSPQRAGYEEPQAGEVIAGERIGGEEASGELIAGEALGGSPGGREVAGEVTSGEAALACEFYAPATTHSELLTDELPELSGLTPSGRYPDLLWAHNDSGNDPTLYAIHTSGALVATLDLPLRNSERVDLEDIDTAPCPRDTSEPCLWIADTGDNTGERDSVSVFVVPEPMIRVSTSPPFLGVERRGLDEDDLIRLRLEYEEGAADVEALAVNSSGETLWLFEKVEDREARVWRYALNLDAIAVDRTPPRQTLRSFTQFASPGVDVNRGRLITAADFSPDGLRLALRVYTGVYLYQLPAPHLVSALPQLSPQLIRLGPLSEPQGEALCYDERYTLWSASEVSDESTSEAQVLTQQRCAIEVETPEND